MRTSAPHEAAWSSGSPKKKSPSSHRRDLRRAAARLASEISACSNDRQQAWANGTDEPTSIRQADRLDRLHADKRAMRREVYREAPMLEGSPVLRHGPKAGG